MYSDKITDLNPLIGILDDKKKLTNFSLFLRNNLYTD